MDVRKKYKWAIDIIKEHCDKVMVKIFDYGYSLAVSVENKGNVDGIYLQRAVRNQKGELISFHSTPNCKEGKSEVLAWITKFMDRE